ncbi:TlpA family protein disulfide reductase [Sulfidibacter corallicola]|uniref:TlpA family protein disulfide reductase n=1 Tax=Sulfidibacter corallicola TaxID=2818388 RepID=A0A8A4U698_SULCO|nr:TlpA disulfide reductase family protein [Sulfidibacter corallicola]QTD54275.1 TlpA family protein disulfide reductase [Sulfidibacter corallicola]
MIRKHLVFISLLAVAGMACTNQSTPPDAAPASIRPELPPTGSWRFVLQSPGGELPFTVLIEDGDNGRNAVALNDAERLEFDRVAVAEDGTVTLSIDHYESVFRGKLNEKGTRLEGTWTKLVNQDRTATLPFFAVHDDTSRFEVTSAEDPVDLAGRWSVAFTQDGEPSGEAIGEFRQEGKRLTGTFLTKTGDYRFLEGVVDGRQLKLSCFDGGHAFLFLATLDEQNRLRGDFWSSDKWHERWDAERNEAAELPDAYSLTELQDPSNGFRFSFPDLEGNLVNHDSELLAGKVRLITLFGSWCPNCNDEAPLLESLFRQYGDRGFQVLGLAFEATGDTKRDTRAIKRFQKRHKLTYPILLAGTKDKAEAGKKLPDLNHLLAYPTSILIDRKGEVVAIHTGFSGPGTGHHYTQYTEDLRRRIEELL